MITYDDALAGLQELVNEFGADHRYRVPAEQEALLEPLQTKSIQVMTEHERSLYAASCFYVHETATGQAPGCIVGHFLNRRGVSLDALLQHENKGADKVITALGVEADDDAQQLLLIVQSSQDQGHTWGEALLEGIWSHDSYAQAEADEEYPEFDIVPSDYFEDE